MSQGIHMLRCLNVTDIAAMLTCLNVTDIAAMLTYLHVTDNAVMLRCSHVTDIAAMLRGSHVTDNAVMLRCSHVTYFAAMLRCSHVTDIAAMLRCSHVTDIDAMLRCSHVSDIDALQTFEGKRYINGVLNSWWVIVVPVHQKTRPSLVQIMANPLSGAKTNIWTNDGFWLIGSLRIKCSEMLIDIPTFSATSAKCRPFCLCFNVLNVAACLGITTKMFSCGASLNVSCRGFVDPLLCPINSV